MFGIFGVSLIDIVRLSMFISHCWTHVPTVSNTPIVTNVNGNRNKAIMPDKHGKSDNVIHWHTNIPNVPNLTIK